MRMHLRWLREYFEASLNMEIYSIHTIQSCFYLQRNMHFLMIKNPVKNDKKKSLDAYIKKKAEYYPLYFLISERSIYYSISIYRFADNCSLNIHL